MLRLSMIFDAGDVVVVPFPFSDIAVAKPRPALVISSRAPNETAGTTVLAMITSASGVSRADDTPISDLPSAGLKAPSVLRLKLFTLDNRLISRGIGTLTTVDRLAASRAIRGLIGL